MRFSIIAFSENGASLAKRISLGLKNNSKDNKTDVYIASRHAESTGFVPFSSVYDLTEGMFNDADAIIYIGACGIAVRAIAPLVKSKLRDPAVIVCDEMGRFAISLLSGHVGGANEITGEIAKIIGANPVITTASDSYNAYYNVQSPKNLVLGIGCRKGLKPEDI
ncbi:MAG: hypothetical protein LBU94_02860, partial [Clostridiales bacterium]|nr:hypothetical protein [Clostridiales bacterium]